MEILGFKVQVQKRKLHKKFCNSVPRLRIRNVNVSNLLLNRSRARVIVNVSHFHPSLIFVGEARVKFHEEPYSGRLGWESLTATNTLAY